MLRLLDYLHNLLDLVNQLSVVCLGLLSLQRQPVRLILSGRNLCQRLRLRWLPFRLLGLQLRYGLLCLHDKLLSLRYQLRHILSDWNLHQRPNLCRMLLGVHCLLWIVNHLFHVRLWLLPFGLHLRHSLSDRNLYQRRRLLGLWFQLQRLHKFHSMHQLWLCGSICL